MKIRTSDPEITKIVQFNLIKAEIRDYLSAEFTTEGFTDLKIINVSPIKVYVTISNTDDLLGGPDRTRFNQIRYLLAKRFDVDVSDLELLIKKNQFPGLCPTTQAEVIRSEMERGMPHRRAVSKALRNIKKEGAQGCMITISGKLKGQRARSVKTIDGKVLFAGDIAKKYTKKGYATLYTKTGLIGIQVLVCLPYDETGKKGPSIRQVDTIIVK